MLSESRILAVLRIRNFRLFIIGHSISVIGTWMQRVAQDWLVYEITGNAFDVGVATAMQFLPVLFFGLWGGVWVDRLDRRRMLLATQATSAVLAGLLAVLVISGGVEFWMVLVLAFALGVVTVVDTPGRQAFIAQLVGPEHYVTGMGLASTIHNAGRLIGPVISGALIGLVGAGAAFGVNAVSFVAVLVGLAMMDRESIRPIEKVSAQDSRVWQGLVYVWGHPELRLSLVLIAVVSLFGQNFRVVFPLLAAQSFHGGAQAYGWLTSAPGAGAVLGALLTATGGRVSSRALLLATVGFGLSNVLLAVSPWLAVALACTGLIGLANIVFNTMARTLLQVRSPDAMHGRVMAVYSFVSQGSTPVGGPLLGWICDAWGPRSGVLVAAFTALAAAAAMLPVHRRARERSLEPPPAVP